MSGLLLTWLINSVSLLIIAYLLKGFYVESFSAALVAALVLGVINTFIRPIFIILTLPINILTLGLFTFVVNALMLKIMSSLVSGIEIDGWGAAILAAILLSIISGLLNSLR
jgi:putative membrane protein